MVARLQVRYRPAGRNRRPTASLLVEGHDLDRLGRVERLVEDGYEDLQAFLCEASAGVRVAMVTCCSPAETRAFVAVDVTVQRRTPLQRAETAG